MDQNEYMEAVRESNASLRAMVAELKLLNKAIQSHHKAASTGARRLGVAARTASQVQR